MRNELVLTWKAGQGHLIAHAPNPSRGRGLYPIHSPSLLPGRCHPSRLELCKAGAGAEPAQLLSLCDRCGQLKLWLQTPCINLLNKTPTRGLRALGTGVNKGFHARSRNYYYYYSKMQRPSPLLANRGKKTKKQKHNRAAVCLGRALVQLAPCCALVWHCMLSELAGNN